jgi:G3E family GTPase
MNKFSPGIIVVISVLADAKLLHSLIKNNASFLNDHVRYIFTKQLEEADILVINKIDLVEDSDVTDIKTQIDAEYPGKIVLYQNSLDETSIQNWISVLDQFQLQKDRISLNLDYEAYAKGEAILGWVDQKITVTSRESDGAAFFAAIKLVQTIYSRIKGANYPIAHLKFLIDDGIQKRKVSFTTMHEDLRTILWDNSKSNEVSILVNARIQVDHSILQQLVTDVIEDTSKETGCTITVLKKTAFQPSYPRPTYRIG